MISTKQFKTILCLILTCLLLNHQAHAENEMTETLDSETLSCLEFNNCATNESSESFGLEIEDDSNLSLSHTTGQRHSQTGKISNMFDTMWDAYPNGESEEVKSHIGGQTNAPWVVNTCTIRISHSLNSSGSKVHAIAGMQSLRGSNHDAYLFRVKDMIRYLSAKFGPPTLKKSSARFSDSSLLKAEFEGRKGIIVFVVKFSDATGHVDLWNGSEVKHADYFDRATEVYLWE